MRSRGGSRGVALAALAFSVLWLGAGPVPSGVDPGEYALATRTLRCDCGCQPQAVRDCSCGRAAEMRDEIAGMLRSGMSGQEVIRAYVARSGEQILLAPKASGFNLAAWLLPGVFFFLAAGGLFLVLRRWRAGSARAASDSGPGPGEAIAPEDLERVRREMEEYH